MTILFDIFQQEIIYKNFSNYESSILELNLNLFMEPLSILLKTR